MDHVETILSGALKRYGCARQPCMVACSGGPDSTALLLATCALREELGLVLSACWVDHGLRPRRELDAERRLVETACDRLGVRLHVVSAHPGQIESEARRTGSGIEAAARFFRYGSFERIAEATGVSRILTAHTADDQMETVLMRLFRGSGAGGLHGIPALRGRFVRPFLDLSKRELLEYLATRDMAWSRDSTNDGIDFTRNRVRAVLMPAIETVFPGWASSIALLAEKSAIDESALSNLSDGMIDIIAGNGTASCRIDSFSPAPAAVRLRALQRMCERAGAGELGFRSVRPLLYGAIAEGMSVDGHGYRVRNEGGRLVLTRGKGICVTKGAGYCREFRSASEIGDHDAGGMAFGDVPVVSWITGMPETWHGIREDAFRFPLLVRSRKPGDTIDLPLGHRLLDKVLMDLGIPTALRDIVPVLEDPDGIVAIMGSATGGRDYRRFNASLDNTVVSRYLIVRFRSDSSFA